MSVIQPAVAIDTLFGENGFALKTATQRYGSATDILPRSSDFQPVSFENIEGKVSN